MTNPSSRPFPPVALALALAIATAAAAAAAAAADPHVPCTPQNRTVTLPLRVNLIFAGAEPIFMRAAAWDRPAAAAFLSALSAVARHPAAVELDEQDTRQLARRFADRQASPSCSVVEIGYSYTLVKAPSTALARLDKLLSEALSASKSIFVPGTKVADAFWNALTEQKGLIGEESEQTYHLLLYNAASVAPQRGYQSEPGSPVRTYAVASEKRFAMLDVGAMPYFLDDSRDSTPGEILAMSNRSPTEYAHRLHKFVVDLFTPSPSRHLPRFPHQGRLVFSLGVVDVNPTIGRSPGSTKKLPEERAAAQSFDPKKFANILRDFFRGLDVAGRKVSVDVEMLKPNEAEDAKISMAVARALSIQGLEMELDRDVLLRDIVVDDEGRSIVDTSLAAVEARIPLYLFSFADDQRVMRFGTDKEVRFRGIRKQAVLLLENRVKSVTDDEQTILSQAVKGVLELLCGLTVDTLSHINSEAGTVPTVLRDIVRRNVLKQELDWSEAKTARKAFDLMNFEGLDSRLIPHGKGSAVAESRRAVRRALSHLYAVWDQAGKTMSTKEMAAVTQDVTFKSGRLADALHEEICKQPLPEEIMLKAEAEVEDDDDDATTVNTIWYYFIWMYLPGSFGVLCGALLHIRSTRRAKAQGAALGEIPVVSPSYSSGTQSSAVWFSTLASPDKPKTS